jgi:catechol 2,3-dioxygenase-like lactoylglutathione lyase family enzyme
MKQNPLVPVLYCSNFPHSLRFYTQQLGFTMIYERPEAKFCFLQRDNVQLMLEEIGADRQWHTAKLEQPFGRGINMQIMTTSVSELFEELQRQHQVFLTPLEVKHYRRASDTVICRQFVLQDPDGYVLRFSEITETISLTSEHPQICQQI